MTLAAARWAALDGDDGDGPSVAELGIDYRWPEPGDSCLDVLATAQLYWPTVVPGSEEPTGGEWEPWEIVRVDGNLICPDCGTPAWRHPYAPWPLDYQRERFVVRLCDGRLGKT